MNAKGTAVHYLKSHFKTLVLLPIMVFLGGVTYGFYLVKQEQSQQHEFIINALNKRLEHISEGVQERMRLYQNGILGLKGAVAAHGVERFDYFAMQRYMASHNFNQEFPGSRGIGFIKLVSPNEEASFIESMQLQRPDGQFTVKKLEVHDKSRFIIQFIEPEKSNREAVGLDIGSEKMRRAAAHGSAVYNEPRLTGPITLVQANKKAKRGFLILWSVYEGKTPTIKEARLKQLRGWSYSPLVIDEVLSSISGLKNDVSLDIIDVTDGRDKQAIHFFNFTSEYPASHYYLDKTITLLGREWQLSLIASERFVEELKLSPPAAMMGLYTLLSGALAMLILSIHMIIARQSEIKNQKLQLAAEKARTLIETNALLEYEVAKRTQEITKANLFQKSIIDASALAIISTNEQGLITSFNPAAEKLLGYSAEEVVGKQTPQIFHVESEVVARAEALSEELGLDIDPGFEVFVTKARMGLSDSNQWTYLTKSGEQIQVKLSVTAWSDDKGNIKGFLGMADDLTVQIEHERVLSEAKDAAEQASRAKSAFLANMSHEIRTPMNGLYGALQLLKSEKVSPQGADLVSKAIYSVKALNTIINDILDFSKIEAGRLSLEKRNFNIKRLIENLRSEFTVMAKEKNLTLTFTLSLANEYRFGDELRIRQVLLNLLSNAIKFTEAGEVSVEITESLQPAGIELQVSDTGIGMPKEVIKRLFARFEQADKSTTRKFGGTGLGLSITHSLVELMSGTIEVESKPGQGSVFTIFLPLVVGEKESVTPHENEHNYDFSDRTFLIAEDNHINQIIVKTMLANTGATLLIANDGVEAIELAQLHCPDLILMDIQMPNMDGIEACKQLKKINTDIRIIALTANAFEDDKALYRRTGFDGYVSKPIEQQELLNSIAVQLYNG
ncbi:CHASE domain-containing protein [Pseudoalteromonas sp. T1lg65]|uniref:CHASE domain-containing protein n=1 Tax=Pseudoalteromonas sp. T1lg65 TaxID=2077101 RepID=UPI003F7946CB